MTEELETGTDEVRTIYTPIAATPTSYIREPEGAHPPPDFEGYKSTALRHPKQPLVYLPQTITEITGPQIRGRLRLAASPIRSVPGYRRRPFRRRCTW